MHDADRELSKLRTAAQRLATAVEKQVVAKAERDALMRDARDAGASWTQIQEAARVSRMTVSNIVNGKQ